MKKFLKAISGEKAMLIVLTILTICSVLDVITAVRMGTTIDYIPIGFLYCMMAIWAECLEEKKNKKDS